MRVCLQRRYEEAEARAAGENARLTQDLQRTAAAFANLQAKFVRFQGGSIARLQDVGCFPMQ
jgi:hypothetical protein